MAQARPSMQELIGRRRRAGFVGRGDERAAFRTNLELPPEDERHRFLFHVHGNAGVGKTFLIRELEQIARERGALTAYVDESVGSVPEAMAAVCDQLGRQGHRCKELERLLAAYRERRHEAEASALDPEAAPHPSAGSLAVARAGLVGLGMVPGVGPFAGALDAAQLAQSADRLRAGLSARLRNQEDVRLVLSPERVLTPALLGELAASATAAPWIVLLFDTYERTGAFLDGWLHEIMTTDRYGTLPANVVLVTAGQLPLAPARWAGFADFVADVRLGPFTETETRGLLADKGVRDEPVVAEVLRLTGGLPVLVSTLAETRPADPRDVGDPSATAVERFLKWEQDPVRRAAALACALPRTLDADVFRAVVECPEEEFDGLYAWLQGMPFVSGRGDRLRYHDLVRAPMLRLQRRQSPRGWAERHRRLAGTFARWRTETESALEPGEFWKEEDWRELRLAESYHLLCADPRAALPDVLADVVTACDHGDDVLWRWVRLLVEAGEDTGATGARTPASWGSGLAEAFAADAVAGVAGLLLDRARGEEPWRATACAVRGDALARGGDQQAALDEYERALALDPSLVRALRGKVLARSSLADYRGALEDLRRVLELEPDNPYNMFLHGEHLRILGRYEEAVADLDQGIRLDPGQAFAWASRGAARLALGELDDAHADLNRALELNPDYAWALARRARLWRARRDRTRQLADLDRALALQPDWAWGRCERGDALRGAGRDEEALVDYDRALALDPDYASAYASRGASQANLGRLQEAVADLDRALRLNPVYVWALERRAEVHRRLGEDALAEADEAHAARLCAPTPPPPRHHPSSVN
ncbi:tetratricopeptide repeat protein [Streptomyces barringtoniae]|uniref:tetratricopeptide repeat protein n=1 Tax=Streptomyces barringtoniae TaxID=2892029 RepID=UPI001E2D14B8|nr:tetratricopeptide repeat protein [Streptomyces barringtoniae]MCC5478719.1 tetratricopeptide repeat protein [Streptomyces barringtoniae]